MSIITPGALVFDIGANIGQSSQLYLEAGAGRVVAVEPCLEPFLELWAKAATDPRITPLHAAAWSCQTILKIFPSQAATGWSSTNPAKWEKACPAEPKWADPQSVAAITIRSLGYNFGVPDCVKIDVEGSEIEVLNGLRDLKPRLIVFESNPFFLEDTLGCLDLLEGFGFSLASCAYDDTLDLETAPDMTFHDLRLLIESKDGKWRNITVS